MADSELIRAPVSYTHLDVYKRQLMTLKGIGESKAEDIIRYREKSGGFKKIEDIMKISGIKEAGFQKIKDSITCLLYTSHGSIKDR